MVKWTRVIERAQFDPTYMEALRIHSTDPEVRITTCHTSACLATGLGSKRFVHFSKFAALRRALANLIVKAKDFKGKRSQVSENGDANSRSIQQSSSVNKSSSVTPQLLRHPTVADLDNAETVMIKTVQRECFPDEIELLQSLETGHDEKNRKLARQKKNLLKGSNLYRLDPFVDEQAVVRVGGRLRRSDMYYPEKHPILLPKGHYLSQLIIHHYHERVHHQGRQITSGAVRAAGYWIVGGHGMVSKIISSCVTCKRLRSASLTQHMSDLPVDRTETPPPFTYVGCDVFGPWTIQIRKTRGGSVDSKRWRLVFTCLNCRAIHIEVLESLDASGFVCALRRFLAIRGPIRRIRCDRGTNFIGGKTEMNDALKEMNEGVLKSYLAEQGCEWSFNPPHASHFGGVWERQIGTIRRVLDAMLLDLGKHQLTHDLLATLLAEVTAIVNARPIATIPSDTDVPQPLSPATLLTMKTCPLPPAPGKFVPQDLYARRRWRRSQYLADQFWLRWRKEYLQNLQIGPKWNKRERNLAVAINPTGLAYLGG